MPGPETTPPAQGHHFFSNLIAGYRSAKTVFVATRLGIFPALADKALTAAELAGALKCDPRTMAVLMEALLALGLVTREAGRFSNSSVAVAHLLPGAPAYIGNNLKFIDLLWDCWSELETVVRTGKPVKSLPELLHAEDPSFTREYIRGMSNFSQGAAREVAQVLSQRPVRRVLDVGAGPGAFTRALLERNPDATGTLLDLPPTLEVARELLAPSAERPRIELRPGNYLTDSYGSGFDLVLLSHVTHDESPAGNARMLAQAYAALEPGGRVAIHDFVLDEQGSSVFNALFSVNMLVYTEGGQTYTQREYEGFLKDAGFTPTGAVPILEGRSPNPTVLIIGEKPALATSTPGKESHNG